MKTALLFLLIIFSFPDAFPQSRQVGIQTLQKQINKVISDPFFNSSQIAVDVFDLRTNKNLFQKNEKLLFRPASNLKILTSTAGLLFLGPEYKFTTSLYYTGYIRDNTLYGDLYIVGGFDPLFSTDDLDTLIIGLKQAGIKKIEGNLYADVSAKDSLFWGAGWMWDDDPSTDAPYLSSLNINDNSVKTAFAPSLVGSLIKINLIPESDFFEVKNTVVTISGDSSKVKVDRDWIGRKNKILVSGYLSNNSLPDTEGVNVYNPPFYFLDLFKERLSRNHILFKGLVDTMTLNLAYRQAGKTANLIGLYKRSFADVLGQMEKKSDNLAAEMTLYALAEKYYGKPASAKNGVKMIDSLIILAGFDPGNYRIVDGSGVSHYNLISSELILGVLKYFYYGQLQLFDSFYKSLPVAGVDGTLEKRMIGTRAQNNLRAKTGTISGVSCLSGYVRARNGHNLAFSIMVQNYVTKTKEAVKFVDQICKLLADYK